MVLNGYSVIIVQGFELLFVMQSDGNIFVQQKKQKLLGEPLKRANFH